ncbi:uncharacterized protein THITE_2107664 [Thermothielavioides terrestris NRRL 8126]|uniref:Uncharacterized protein n=1 Tax=Thermothielavioides terrestris (strain ATCC 38088 / NRRL 8126) TaxID=578455 RepID=G2QUP4_THETT|nr:uncharacterized protein THITE_2107664 [Thermothielavioides terrestris NRRL 8126]AEO62889.1 hypothetical protein THITE_2107664 [Thermothielavioides terrestris NRRL 8126]
MPTNLGRCPRTQDAREPRKMPANPGCPRGQEDGRKPKMPTIKLVKVHFPHPLG